MRQRGFTLLELMVTLGVGSILGMSFFGVMYFQSQSYVQRLDELDAHQNAYAALDVMRHAIQGARFGLGQGVNAGGIVPLGRCFDSGNPQASVGACNNVDAGADRMRVVSLVADANFQGDPNVAAGDPCTGNSNSVIEVSFAPAQPFLPGSLVGIGGTCGPTSVVGSPLTASDVMSVVADLGARGACLHRYTFTLLEGGGAQMSCPGGYARYFTFGSAAVTDFYVGAFVNGQQALYMNTHGGALTYRQQLVAYNVEDLQIVYGIDTSEVPDHTYDAWCSDPRPSAAGGQCDLTDSGGNAISQAGLYSRIVLVRLYVRMRSAAPRPSLLDNPPISDPNYLALSLGNPVLHPNDGYRRWLYSTDVNLRNNNP